MLIVSSHSVFVRSSWSQPWTPAPFLHCDEAVFSTAPTIPTATLRWNYGVICQPGQHAFFEVLKQNLRRYYVWVSFAANSAPEFPGSVQREWYGVVEVDNDEHGGEIADPSTLETIATGEQTILAYGMEHLLDREIVRRSWFDKDGAGDLKIIEQALTFNRNGKPNRSAAPAAGVYHFSNNPDTAVHWSTRDIIDYLLKYHTPRTAADVPFTDWYFVDNGMGDAAPNWDKPELDPEGKTVYALLTSLLPRQRLAGFWFQVVDTDASGVNEDVILKPYTFTDTAVTTTVAGNPIPANNRQRFLRFGGDHSAAAVVKTSTLDHYDQTIMRGRRRRTCFTLAYLDSTIDKGWAGLDEVEYEKGASEATGYGDLVTSEKRRRNAQARGRPKLINVFRRFKIIAGWDGEAGDGAGGTPKHPVFIDLDWGGEVGTETAAEHYELELFLEQTLPLIEGVDYSGDAIQDQTFQEPNGESDANEAPPIVLWKNPDNSKYARIDKLSDAGPLLDEKQQLDWSASVNIPDEDRAVLLAVSGAPQHVLDYLEFSPLEDVDEDLGENNWRNATFTVSIEENRYAEVRYPLDGDLPPLAPGDYARRLVIEAGNRYRLDWVVPGTIVDVDEEGEPKRSTGGFVHDDREELLAIAKVAYAYYSRIRRVLYVSTDLLWIQATDDADAAADVWLGDMVMQVSAEDADLAGTHFTLIRTPVTEVRIQTAWGTDPDAPRMTLVTDAGQLDAVGLFADRAADAPEIQRAKPFRSFRDHSAPLRNPNTGRPVPEHGFFTPQGARTTLTDLRR